MSALDTFVADCLRIIAARKRRKLADWKEQQLKHIITMEQETHITEADWAGPVEDDAYANYGAELAHPQV